MVSQACNWDVARKAKTTQINLAPVVTKPLGLLHVFSASIVAWEYLPSPWEVI